MLSFVARIAPLVLLLPFTVPLSRFVKASTPQAPRAVAVCNGNAILCDRSFGNVTFVGAHNSYAVGVNNLAANQDYNITQQLRDGVRMLQVQTHNLTGVIQLCHSSCSLYNGGPFSAYLSTVKAWLDANPNEVLSLLIVNADGFSPIAYEALFKGAGLDTMSYAPPSASMPATQWPTLASLINSGKRLVTFMDASADFNSVPYIIDEFTNIWETAYDVTTTFDCSVNRTQGDASTQMMLINHFLDTLVLGLPVPDPSRANQTNAVSESNSLGQQISLCASEHGRYPNFMLVDFYEYGRGSVFKAAAAANRVAYSPATPIATPSPQGTAGSGSPSLIGLITTPVQWSTAVALVTSIVLVTRLVI